MGARGRSGLTTAAWVGTVVFGGLHALSSLYWGLGGTALVETIGRAAVELRADPPWWIFPALVLVGLLKVAGIVVPLAATNGRLRPGRVWRSLSWVGGLGLVLYGGVYTVVAHLALAGLFGEVEDRPGMLGHAWLWDPLFLLWGACLLVALATTRPTRPT